MAWLPLTRHLLKVPPAPISTTDRGALIIGPWGGLQISASAGAGSESYGKSSPGEVYGEDHILGLHL